MFDTDITFLTKIQLKTFKKRLSDYLYNFSPVLDLEKNNILNKFKNDEKLISRKEHYEKVIEELQNSFPVLFKNNGSLNLIDYYTQLSFSNLTRLTHLYLILDSELCSRD